MPIIYPKKIRKKLHSLNLEKVKESLIKNGYKFIRDGGFRPDDEPFKFSNYLFYRNPETQIDVRVGYDYPIFGNKNHIFEICYATPTIRWWTDITPNFSQTCWKEVSDWYELINGKYIRKI